MSFPSDLEVAVAVGEFDVAGEWESDGSTSAVAWLRARGLAFRDAAEFARIGAKLRRLPVVAEAWLNGTLTSGQVKVICARVIDATSTSSPSTRPCWCRRSVISPWTRRWWRCRRGVLTPTQ